MNAKRDWGHAKDYVKMQWLMFQQDKPDDFVIATGEQHSVREFIKIASRTLGINISWQGTGVDEKGINTETGEIIIAVDPKYFRPTEVESLMGAPTKAKEKLGWSPKIAFRDPVSEMVNWDFEEAKKRSFVQKQWL